MKIETSHDGYQHLATTSNYDGPGSPIGTSRVSEAEAVADLKEQLRCAECGASPCHCAEDRETMRQDFERMIYQICDREDALKEQLAEAEGK